VCVCEICLCLCGIYLCGRGRRGRDLIGLLHTAHRQSVTVVDAWHAWTGDTSVDTVSPLSFLGLMAIPTANV